MTDRELEIELGKALGMRVENYTTQHAAYGVLHWRRLVDAAGAVVEQDYDDTCTDQEVALHGTPPFLTDALPLLIEQMNKRGMLCQCEQERLQADGYLWTVEWRNRVAISFYASDKALNRAICEAALAALKSEVTK